MQVVETISWLIMCSKSISPETNRYNSVYAVSGSVIYGVSHNRRATGTTMNVVYGM